MLNDSIMTFVSVIPITVQQDLDSVVILIAPVMVGYGVHSPQTTWRMLPKWCCMTGLENSIVYY